MLAVVGQAFDGGDVRVGDGGDRAAAGADRLAIDVNGAGAALRNAATEFGAGQSQFIVDGSGVSGSISSRCTFPLTLNEIMAFPRAL
jgi:hypothetical protein